MACLILRLRSRVGHPRAVISDIAEVCAVCFLGRVFVSRLSIFPQVWTCICKYFCTALDAND